MSSVRKKSDNILQRIHNSALRFLVPLNSEEVYKIIVEEAIKLVSAKYGSLLLEQNDELIRVYTTLPEAEKIKIRKNGFTYASFKKQIPMIKRSKDFPNTQRIYQMSLLSNIFIPLAYRSRSVGVLIVNSHAEQQFTRSELEALKLFGSFASLAIRKSQLHDETQAALETRDLFISMAAHELRTPITTISGYAQLLKNKLGQKETPESRWVSELNRETTRMAMLVNELLEANKIRLGEFNYNFKENSIKEIIQRSLNNFKFTHPEREVIFEDKLGAYSDVVISDFDKLVQVVTNLIENALKYSQPHTSVTITLKHKAPDLIIQVKDTGQGISKKDLDSIFEKYFRDSNTTVEGMGLGLYLVKNIIDKHRGTIKYHSKLNKGTTVQVFLPESRI